MHAVIPPQLQFGQVLTMTSPLIDLSQVPLVDSLILDFCYINSSQIEIDEDGIRVFFSPDSGQTWIQQFEDNSRTFTNWEVISLPLSASYHTAGFRIRFEGFSGNSTGDVGIDGLLLINKSDNCGITPFAINVSGDTRICSDQIADTLFLPDLVPGQQGVNGTYALTDPQDSLVSLVSGGFIDLNTLSKGTYTLRGVKYLGALQAPLGSHISEWTSSNCLDISTNSIEIQVTQLAAEIQITSPFGVGVSCEGEEDAELSIVVNEGSPPYDYSWNTGATDEVLNGLGAGTYIVQLTDQNQCVARDTVEITEPDPLEANIMVVTDFNGQAISCQGAADGSLFAEARGGTAPYNYLWSTGANTDTINDLSARQYIVFVGDSYGCVALDSLSLSEPERVVVTATVISDFDGDDISGPDAQDGEVSATVEGGTPPYQYSWNTNPSQEGPIASDLGAGVYEVVVSDQNACTDSATVAVRSPGSLSVRLNVLSDYSGSPISCPGETDASLVASISGGIPPYRIEWMDLPEFEGQDTLSQLGPGIYEVRVQDAENIEATASISLESPSEIELSILSSDPACPEQATGSLEVLVSGGTPGYTFSWSDGSQDSLRTSLVPGLYGLTVLDGNGCLQTDSATIASGPGLFATYSVVEEGCIGAANGSILANLENGAPPYAYLWSTGEISESIENLTAGPYTVQISDSIGCVLNDTVEVGLSDSLQVTLQISGDPGDGTGSALAQVSGGTPPYTYSWSTSPIDSTMEIVNVSAGEYILEVGDAALCTLTEAFEIPRTGDQCPPIHIGFSPNGDGVNDTWVIPCIEEFENNTVSIIGRWGQTLVQFPNYDNNWQGEVEGNPLPAGSYFFTIQSGSSTRVFKGTLTLIR